MKGITALAICVLSVAPLCTAADENWSSWIQAEKNIYWRWLSRYGECKVEFRDPNLRSWTNVENIRFAIVDTIGDKRTYYNNYISAEIHRNVAGDQSYGAYRVPSCSQIRSLTIGTVDRN